jgi:ligand-binding sensor domain-containing protein
MNWSYIKTSNFSLLIFLFFCTGCRGQTSKNHNHDNSTEKTVRNPQIVRTLGTNFQVVHCELLDSDGHVWFSITGDGAYRYDGKSFTNFTTKDGLCNNNVSAIIQDESGNFLFGTDKGICKYDGKNFTNIPITDTLNITSLFEDRDGILWIGVMNKGIYKYDGTNLSNVLFKYKHPFYGYRAEKFISDIIQDSNGNIWFSSWNGGGVWRYDGKNFKHFLPSLDYYKTNQDNRKIAGTQNTLDFNLGQTVFIQSQEYISDDMIFSMTEDHLGNIWFATRNHGACRFDGKIFTEFGTKQGQLSGGAYAILEDKKGNFWFTTEKDGVWRYDGKTMKNFNEMDGLVNNAVMNVLEDKEGNLWFGTKGSGLSRFDGKNFVTFSQ